MRTNGAAVHIDSGLLFNSNKLSNYVAPLNVRERCLSINPFGHCSVLNPIQLGSRSVHFGIFANDNETHPRRHTSYPYPDEPPRSEKESPMFIIHASPRFRLVAALSALVGVFSILARL